MLTLVRGASFAGRLGLTLLLLGAVLLSACTGSAQINVEVDPEGDGGSVSIVGSGEAAEGSDGGQSGSQPQFNQLLLFIVVIALFLGLVAVVASAARRPR